MSNAYVNKNGQVVSLKGRIVKESLNAVPKGPTWAQYATELTVNDAVAALRVFDVSITDNTQGGVSCSIKTLDGEYNGKTFEETIRLALGARDNNPAYGIPRTYTDEEVENSKTRLSRIGTLLRRFLRRVNPWDKPRPVPKLVAGGNAPRRAHKRRG